MALQSYRGPEVRSLTGLRGVAALFVVGFHCHTIFPSRPLPNVFAAGFIGVDVFFVLSGYMLASLYSNIAPDGYLPFWLKRICRIYPLHLTVMVGLAATVGLATLFGLHAGAFYSTSSFLKVAALLNVYTGDHGWNDPTWSIAVEMGCYLAFPFGISLLRRCPKSALGVLAIGLALADVAFVTSVARSEHGIVFVPIVGWIPVLRGFLGFTLGCALSGLITMETFRRGPVCDLLASRPVYKLGEISFSLYLLHQPIIEMLLKLDPALARHGLAWIETPTALGAALGLSFLTYAWVEVPGRNLPKWLQGKRRSMVQGGARGIEPAAPANA